MTTGVRYSGPVGERSGLGCGPWCSCVPEKFSWPVIPVRCPVRRLGRLRGYGVDATAMSLEQHGWDIHALMARGGHVSRVTEVYWKRRGLAVGRAVHDLGELRPAGADVGDAVAGGERLCVA